MAAYDERSEACSYLLLARRRSFVIGSGPCGTIPPWGLPALRGLPLRKDGAEYLDKKALTALLGKHLRYETDSRCTHHSPSYGAGMCWGGTGAGEHNTHY